MRWIDTVAAYVPSLIVDHLINRATEESLPTRQELDTVCMFCDVSGFTALSEAMVTQEGGVEGLAKHLNAYFAQMVRVIASEGGDVFKFAGDALISLWPPPARESLPNQGPGADAGGGANSDGEKGSTSTPMERRVRRAAQCAFAIQEELHDCVLAEGVRLSVKIGLGIGKVSVLHLGGVHKRMEYVAVGEPLLQAFTAEHHATAGQVVLSQAAWSVVKGHFHAADAFGGDGFVRITKPSRYVPLAKRNKRHMLPQSLDDPLLEVKLRGYIPGAVLKNLRPESPEDEHWSNEIRQVSVLFMNLGLEQSKLLAAAVYKEAMHQMHRLMIAVQRSVYEYEGSINKFLMDDKGSTLVAVFGLPPVAHEDDAIRAVLASLRLCDCLFELGLMASVGVTTGDAFCGVVGSKTRREYTVLGDSVNLAARLMQRAGTEDGGILCDLNTKRACMGLLQFKARGDFKVKGKVAPTKVFQPYPPDFSRPRPPGLLGPNMYKLMMKQQKQNYAMHKLLNGLQAYFARAQALPAAPPANPPLTGLHSQAITPAVSRLSSWWPHRMKRGDSGEKSSESRSNATGSHRPSLNADLSLTGTSGLSDEGPRERGDGAGGADVVQAQTAVQGPVRAGDILLLVPDLSPVTEVTQDVTPPKEEQNDVASLSEGRAMIGPGSISRASSGLTPRASSYVRRVFDKSFKVDPNGRNGHVSPTSSYDCLPSPPTESTQEPSQDPPSQQPHPQQSPPGPAPLTLLPLIQEAPLPSSSAPISAEANSTQPPGALSFSNVMAAMAAPGPPLDRHESEVSSAPSSPQMDGTGRGWSSRSAPDHLRRTSLRPSITQNGLAPMRRRSASSIGGTGGTGRSWASLQPAIGSQTSSRTPSLTVNGLASPYLCSPSRISSARGFLSQSGFGGPRLPSAIMKLAAGGGRGSAGASPRASFTADVQVQVTIPNGWKIWDVQEGSLRLPPLTLGALGALGGVSSFMDLLRKCWEMARDQVVLTGGLEDSQPQDFTLNILGTRAFLPKRQDLDVKWLPAFVAEALYPADQPLGGHSSGGAEAGGPVVDLCFTLQKEILNVQSRWMQTRLHLLQCKIDLLQHHQGSVTLVEGGPGAGKTAALSLFAAHTLPRTAPIHFTAASPFSHNVDSKPFAAWAMVLQQFLDLQAAAVGPGHRAPEALAPQDVPEMEERSSISQATDRSGSPPSRTLDEPPNPPKSQAQMVYTGRERVLLDLLSPFPVLHANAHVVNDVLSTCIAEGAESKAPRRRSRAVSQASSFENLLSDNLSQSGSEGSDFSEDDHDIVEEGPEGPQRIRALQLRILFQLVKSMARAAPRVVIIDDAQFLDPDSWTLALALSTRGPLQQLCPLMLVLAIRPLESFRGVYTPMHPDYQALCEMDHVRILKVDGLPPEEVEDLVASSLGSDVVTVGDSVMSLVEETCLGNPLAIRELVTELKMANPPKLRYVEIQSEEGAGLDASAAGGKGARLHVTTAGDLSADGLQVPSRIAMILNAQIDRLSSCAQMILKCGALIGKEFSARFLFRVYPIKGHKGQLLDELDGLERKGFLARVTGSAPALFDLEWQHFSGMVALPPLGGATDPVYRFVHGFMRQTLVAKMLISHRDKVAGVIDTLSSRIETRKRQQVFKDMDLDGNVQLKAGQLGVYKTQMFYKPHARALSRRKEHRTPPRRPSLTRLTDPVFWKQRHCVLTGDCLSLYHWPQDPLPAQTIFLQGAKAELLENRKAFPLDNAFRIDCVKWSKGGLLHEGPERSFHMYADTKDSAVGWVDSVRYAIEMMEVRQMKQRENGTPQGRRPGAQEQAAPLPADAANAREFDGILSVRVKGAQDLVLMDVYGATNPFVVLELDGQRRRTNLAKQVSSSPEWDEELSFPVSARHWVWSALKIQVWNHDLFLTDDYLGGVSVDLSELEVLEPEQMDSADATFKWLRLEPRKPGEAVQGEIIVGLRLFMAKHTRDWARQLGSVSALKQEVARRARVAEQAAKAGRICQQEAAARALAHHKSSSNLGGAVQASSADLGPRGLRRPDSRTQSQVRMSVTSVSSGQEGAAGVTGAVPARALTKPPRRWSWRSSITADQEEPDMDKVLSQDELFSEGEGSCRAPSLKRRGTSGKRRRAGSGTNNIYAVTGTTPHPTHPISRRLQLALLAVETRAPAAMGGDGTGVNRDWVRTELKQLLHMAAQDGELLEDLDGTQQAYFVKDRRDNVYGPFPIGQLVEAHNAGYMDDNSVQVRNLHQKGDYRPIGQLALGKRAGTEPTEPKPLECWPPCDAQHPLAAKILSSEDPARNFRELAFDILCLDESDLPLFVATVFHDTGLPAQFGWAIKTFHSFVSAVSFYMTRNTAATYHNLHHGADVMHMCYLMLRSPRARGLLSDLDSLILLVAALCHDLDHPGLNNSFQIATQSPLALRYNDQSPLENHHASVALGILRRPQSDLFGALSGGKALEPHEASLVRRRIVLGILATDMAQHFKLCQGLKDLTGRLPALSGLAELHPLPSTGSPPQEPPGQQRGFLRSPVSQRSSSTNDPARTAAPPLELEADRQLLFNAMLHGADVSCPGRSWGVCQAWVERLMEEFDMQTMQEEALGLPVTALSGLGARRQVDFIDIFLMPYFTELRPLAPQLLDEWTHNLTCNRGHWMELVDEHHQREARSAQPVSASLSPDPARA